MTERVVMRISGGMICWLVAMTTLSLAEPYPAHADLFVNDLAGVIEPEAATRIRDQLEQLKTETGVEISVLTIPSRADYDASPSIGAFAQGLFNAWGIGDAARNDGVLLLAVTGDREMRLQLGAGYDQGYDVLAQDIVSRYIVPEFRDGRLSEGIEIGVTETVARIVRRHLDRLPPEALRSKGVDLAVPVGLGGVLLVGLIAFRRRIGDAVAGFRRCPQCGARGLHRHSEVVVKPSAGVPGLTRDITTCPNCSYADRRDRAIPFNRRSGGSGGSFGGGKSSGGGATGRW